MQFILLLLLKIFRIQISSKSSVPIIVTFSIISCYLIWTYRFRSFEDEELSTPLFFISRTINLVLIFPLTAMFITRNVSGSLSLTKLVVTCTFLVGMVSMIDSMLLFYMAILKIFSDRKIWFKRLTSIVACIIMCLVIFLVGFIDTSTWYIVPVIITCVTFLLDEKSIVTYYSFRNNQLFTQIKLSDNTIRNTYLIRISVLSVYVLYAISLAILEANSLDFALNTFLHITSKNKSIFYRGITIIQILGILSISITFMSISIIF